MNQPYHNKNLVWTALKFAPLSLSLWFGPAYIAWKIVS